MHCVQSLAAAQQHSDVSRVDTVSKLVADLEQQLRAAEKEAALLNAREGLLGRAATDYSQIKQLSDVFDPFLQFWSTAGAWKVIHGGVHRCSCLADLHALQRNLPYGCLSGACRFAETCNCNLSCPAGEPESLDVRPG